MRIILKVGQIALEKLRSLSLSSEQHVNSSEFH